VLNGREQAGHQVHLSGRLMKQHLEPDTILATASSNVHTHGVGKSA